MASDWKIHTKDRKFIYFNEGEEKDSSESFYFVQGADTQLGLKDAYINDKKGLPLPTGRYWAEEIQLSEKAVECINRLQPPPSFVVICGDLCHAYPATNKEMRAMQEKDFKDIMSKINPEIPLVCVCGNHDVGNQPTSEGVSLYRSSFGDDYYSFWVNGVLFIVLNSQYYFDSSQIPHIYEEQEHWLDSQLQQGKNKNARIIVFQHIPFFVENIEEPDQYFNLPKSIRKSLLDKLHAAGVTHAFCGHLHYNAHSVYKSLEIITTTAVGYQLGTDTHGMRVVKFTNTGLEQTFHALDNFPQTITL
ncbi:hypothetical protein ONE63_004611 [Megalurothrips usitatus]|uniref:Serine/threonine-protein phosphatase CPPED1 n=1 Tax=Megalurothrips usitatus TaxID=439358 RepID=A0AAV7X427_9NEOP|nr:hypothetical protein ONE63_004611 [Megalurothrips usitatus]